MKAGRFSRRTIVAAIDVLEKFTHAEFDRFIRGLGPEISQRLPTSALSLKKRLNALIDLFDGEPTYRVNDELLSDTIVKEAVSLLPAEKTYTWEGASHYTPSMQAFLQGLVMDGFVVADGEIRSQLPATLELPQVEDEISRLLEKHGLTTAKGHLTQAMNAHGRQEWASANGQLRCFLYSVQLRIRNSFGKMIRKLSETVVEKTFQFAGTSSRRKVRVAFFNSANFS